MNQQLTDEYITSKIQTGASTLALAMKDLIDPPPSINILGWPKFNDSIRGLRMKEFSIFCGPTGGGKTQFLAALSAKLLVQGIPQFIMSVETGGPDYAIRMLSAINRRDYNTGLAHSTEEIKEAVQNCGGAFSKNLYSSTYDSRIPCDELLLTVKKASMELGAKVIIMDNINYFTEVTRSSDALIAIDSTIHALVELTKQIDSHLIMVMHPKKTDNGRVENEFDIKGSSTAVQEASNVFLFNRYQENPTSTFREIFLAKLRKNGKSQGKTILFHSPDGVSYDEAGHGPIVVNK